MDPLKIPRHLFLQCPKRNAYKIPHRPGEMGRFCVGEVVIIIFRLNNLKERLMKKISIAIVLLNIYFSSFCQTSSDTLSLMFPDNTDLFQQIRFSNNGNFMACITETHRNNINVYDVKSQKLLFILSDNLEFILSIGFSPNDKYIFSTSVDSTIRVFDVYEKRELLNKKIINGKICKVSFISESLILYSTSSNQIGLWDLKSNDLSSINVGGDSEKMNIDFKFNTTVNRILVQTDSRIFFIEIGGGINQQTELRYDIELSRELENIFSQLTHENVDLPNCKIKISEDGHLIFLRDKNGLTYSISIDSVNLIFKKLPIMESEEFILSPNGNFIISFVDKSIKAFNTIKNESRIIPVNYDENDSKFDIAFTSKNINHIAIFNDNDLDTLIIYDLSNCNIVHEYVYESMGNPFRQDEFVVENEFFENELKYFDLIDGKFVSINAVTARELFFYSISSNENIRISKTSSLYPIESALVNPNEFKFEFPFSENDKFQNIVFNIASTLISYNSESKEFGYNTQLDPVRKNIIFYEGDQFFSICNDRRNYKFGTYNRFGNAGKCKVINSGHKRGIEGVVYSPDFNFIASSSFDRSIKLFSFRGIEIADFVFHTKPVISSTFSSDSKYLISKGRDNVLGVWSIESLKLLYFVIFYENGDRLIKLPNSPYYMCSKEASKMLHYVTPSLKVIGFEQLDPVYNRPDIVLDSIGKYFGNEDRGMIDEYRKSWEKRIDRLGLDKEKLGKGEISVPNAEILGADDIAYENKEGSLNIKVEANDSKYTLSRFNVYVNEVPIYGSLGISISHLQVHKWDTTLTVPLSFGENKIQVSVMNELGLENFKYPTYVNFTPINNDIVAKTYYIGIGVNEFLEQEHNLKYCVKDVQDLSKVFAEGNSNVDTLLLTNKEVTRENVLKLKEFLSKTTVNDKVIISCSSHGLLDASLNFYLAMYDVDFNNPKARGLKYEELESLLDGIPARQKLLLLDACNSGENDKTEVLKQELQQKEKSMDSSQVLAARGVIIKLEEENKSNFKKMNELFVNVRNNTGSVIISAAGGQESALEAIKVDGEIIENGAFTFSVLEYLNSNKTNSEALTVNKLKQYAEKRVEEITNGKQKPTSRQETMEVDWGVR